MKYDFTSIIDRRGKDAIAVDVEQVPEFFKNYKVKEGFDIIPMWVADMNFPTAPSIQKAISDRVAHPMFGYFQPREEYYNAIINWQKNRNGIEGLKREDIGYENGVIGGVVSALRVLCEEGAGVLIHSPRYIGFTGALKNNGFRVVDSPLQIDDEGVWRMDYDDMDKKIKEYKIHAAIFCSPHNPTGRVWEKEEIEKAMEVYRENDVYVIADEIWSDIILGNNKHIPTQSVSADAKDRTIALYAPSKTFNLAGLVGSYHIIYNKYLRDRIEKQSSLSHYNEMNVLSMYGLIGAYSAIGMEWVDELRQVIEGNVNYAYGFVKNKFNGVQVSKPQGTYMLFLDCKEWCQKHNVTLDELNKMGIEVGVLWQDGRPFGGEYTLRMNLASPKSRIEEAFDRLDKYVF